MPPKPPATSQAKPAAVRKRTAKPKAAAPVARTPKPRAAKPAPQALQPATSPDAQTPVADSPRRVGGGWLAVGVGSAALVAALLFATRAKRNDWSK